MNILKDFNAIRKSEHPFSSTDKDVPINVYSQTIYSGINLFNLLCEAKFHNKTLSFITPLQARKLGGTIATPADLYFKREDLKKLFKNSNKIENPLENRKEILYNYSKGNIEGFETGNLQSYVKIEGSKKFDVFVKETLPTKVYIDGRYGLAQSQIDSLSKMEYPELTNFLNKLNIPFQSKPFENKDATIVLSEITNTTEFQVVSTDDILGLKNEEVLNKNFLNESAYFKSSSKHSDLEANIFNILHEKYEIINSNDEPTSTPAVLKNYVKQVAVIEVNNYLHKTNDNVSLNNKNALVELVSNRIFNKLNLHGFDNSLEQCRDLFINQSNVESFKEDFLYLQNTSYRIANDPSLDFYEQIKNMIENVYNFDSIKEKIKDEIKNISDSIFYTRSKFSTKDKLTIFDIHKVNYQFKNMGRPLHFDNWIKQTLDSFNWKYNSIDDNTIEAFINNLGDDERKSVKERTMSQFFDLKIEEKQEEYNRHIIDFDLFEKVDFHAFLVQNNIDKIIPFLYQHIANDDLVSNVEFLINDNNKVSFKKNINTLLTDLYKNIKNDISAETLREFNKDLNLQR